LVGEHKKQEKIYPADPGLLAAARYLSEPLYDSETIGLLLETAVCANLAYYTWHEDLKIRYWRSKKSEMGFVMVHRGKPIMAVEAKSGGKISKSVHEFHSAYPDTLVRLMSMTGDTTSREKGPRWLIRLPAFVELIIGTNAIRKKLMGDSS